MKRILLIENGSRHTLAFAHHLTPYHVERAKYRDVSPSMIEAADVIVLSGGHPAVFRHHWFYRRQIELIRTTNKPILGICLGFELIIRAFGGRLHRLPRKIHGIRAITIATNELGLANGVRNVWEAHKWVATETPDQVHVVAASNHGPEIVAHSSRPIVACQFHPEIGEPSNDGPEILTTLMSYLSSRS